MKSNYVVSFVSYTDEDSLDKEFFEYCPPCWSLYNDSAQCLGIYGWDEMDVPVKHMIICDGCGCEVHPELELV